MRLTPEGEKLYAHIATAFESIEAGEIGFVPHEMLFGSPELTGIFSITLDKPITPRSIYLFQRKNQPLSPAAKHFRKMLLSDASSGS